MSVGTLLNGASENICLLVIGIYTPMSVPALRVTASKLVLIHLVIRLPFQFALATVAAREVLYNSNIGMWPSGYSADRLSFCTLIDHSSVGHLNTVGNRITRSIYTGESLIVQQ